MLNEMAKRLPDTAFEKKVETQVLEGVDIQEDYHEWYFWRECKRKTEDVLQSLRRTITP